MPDLTPKQEAFCLSYIETGNATEAYRRAYSSENYGENALNVQASKMLKHPKVALRLTELRQVHAKRHEVTVDSITTMLRDAYNLAMKEEVEAPAAAVSAALGLAKLHGHIIEKKHVVGEHQHTHVAEPLSETNRWLEDLTSPRKAGKVASSSTH